MAKGKIESPAHDGGSFFSAGAKSGGPAPLKGKIVTPTEGKGTGCGSFKK